MEPSFYDWSDWPGMIGHEVHKQVEHYLSQYNKNDIILTANMSNLLFEEENSMNHVDSQVAEEIRKRREAAELEKKLQLVEQYGEDVYDEGTAISFEKKYGDKTYTVWGGKVAGKWYLTGPVVGREARTWDELVLFLVGGEPVRPDQVKLMISVAEAEDADDLRQRTLAL